MALSVEETAKAFAQALDQDDWQAAEKCLSPDCSYICRGTTSLGSAQIVDSYRKIGEWVRKSFESVAYESSIEVLSESQVKIRFRDLIKHQGHTLDFRCEQLLQLGEAGTIQQIEHFDLPGMLEKAAAFNKACGVERP